VNDHGTAAPTTYRFEFTGRSGEYFRIWVVSLTGDATPEGFESEADDYALAMLKRHGQSPQAFADLMRRLRLQLHAKEESGSLLQYLSTHPATEERIQRAEEQR